MGWCFHDSENNKVVSTDTHFNREMLIVFIVYLASIYYFTRSSVCVYCLNKSNEPFFNAKFSHNLNLSWNFLNVNKGKDQQRHVVEFCVLVDTFHLSDIL